MGSRSPSDRSGAGGRQRRSGGVKIVIISSLFPPFDIGGAEQVAALLARTLRQLGHQIDVISTCRRSDLSVERYRIDCWEGIRVWRMAPWNVYWSFDKQEQRPHALRRAAWHFIDLCNWSVVPALAEVLNRISPDVVNTHNIDGMSPVVWRVARDYTSAVVHTLHDYHLICPRATMRKRDGAACDSVCGLCHSYSACIAFINAISIASSLHRSQLPIYIGNWAGNTLK